MFPDILREELDEHGVEFDSALAYEEAIQRLASLTYDLVILDVMGVRGFRASRIRQREADTGGHAYSTCPQPSIAEEVHRTRGTSLPAERSTRSDSSFSRRCPDPQLSVSMESTFREIGQRLRENISAPTGENRKRNFGKNSRRISRSMSLQSLNRDPSVFSPQKTSGGFL